MVMKLAHVSIMAGHVVIKRTVKKMLSEFFVLGLLVMLKDFVSLAVYLFCDNCKRTIPKGKIIKAPLGRCLGLMYHFAECHGPGWTSETTHAQQE